MNEETGKLLLEFNKYGKVLEIPGPVCMLYTRTGSIPHLTQETLKYLSEHLINKTNLYEIPIPSVVDFQETLQSFDGDCAELFSLSHSCLTCCFVQDPIKRAEKGYNTNKSVAVWGNGGRVNLNPTSYMSLVEALKPDIFESLSDGDVVETDSRKRVLKSVNRSLKFLEDCIVLHSKSKKLTNSKMICAIQGRTQLSELKRFCEELKVLTKEHCESVWGYTLDVPKDIDDVTKEQLKCIKEILVDKKPLLIPGVGHPLSIIDYLKENVFFFDSSYVVQLVENKLALTYKLFDVDKCLQNTYKCEDDIDIKNFEELVDLSDESYKFSFIPIVADCTCYTCKNHTCAYIYHLISVNEMLASVLLTIHNLHHHLCFFQLLRNCRRHTIDYDTIKSCLLRINTEREISW